MHNQFFQSTFPVKFFSIVSNKNTAVDGTCCHLGRQSREHEMSHKFPPKYEGDYFSINA